MSTSGPRIELVVAVEAIILFSAALFLLMRRDRSRAQFCGLVLVIPLLLEVKHAFVRQDAPHIAAFFCFVALALALITLMMPLNDRFAIAGPTVVLLLFAILWQDYVARNYPDAALSSIIGITTPSLVWDALHFERLRRSLDAEGRENYSRTGIEPEIKSIVGREPVGFLSEVYSNALIDNLNLTLFPVIQGSGAHRPYLDGLNASWIDEKGPRFLIFDGKAIDGRHPWTQSPATWTEVYRWYNTRMLSARNLLLERRVEPRFTRLEPFAKQTAYFGEDLAMPASPGPVYWSMQCSLSATGKVRALIARIPAVMMDVTERDGRTGSFRVILPVLEAPSPGNFLPSSLVEFAEVFDVRENRDFSVSKLKFRSLGKSAYQPDCEAGFLRAVP